ncbi:Oidioi.mRNA.OKI2018_I69.XSR.g16047.t1.cds [Oikopleura dioica]|uniref:Oidioi.mRNA.OKI2018_I69.XSR.g16047.t1.cds n=1 Tax=Oikopleura dioica TaxID=34765 RepID=A0ABN7SP47_OIKDI|nr:Oidioi.mRNA.OKI2018_I69.XSR.g16047.t1.cds [Oikopleura dioica]
MMPSQALSSIHYWRTHKMDLQWIRKKTVEENAQTIRGIIHDFQITVGHVGSCDPDIYRSTYEKIKNIKGIFDDFGNFSDEEKERLRYHIYLFLKMWDPNRSGYTIRECLRYSSDTYRGGALYATCDFKKGEWISELKGCIAPLPPEIYAELIVVGRNDYSIQLSSRNGQQLWLGPAAFLNHDCRPNCKIVPTGPHSAQVLVLEDIKANEELLIYYGERFFGEDNIACECRTCESIGAGAFSNGNTAVRRSPVKFNSGNFSLRMTGNRRRRADNKDGRKSTIVNEETAEADANENIPKSEPIDEPPKRRKRRRSSLAFDQSSCPGVVHREPEIPSSYDLERPLSTES